MRPSTSSLPARVKAVNRKVRRALSDRTLGVKLRRRVRKAAVVPAWSLVSQIRLSPEGRSLDVARGFSDHRGQEYALTCSDDAVGRLAAAFRAATADWPAAPEALTVRGLWAEWLALHYADLREALLADDRPGLRSTFENMHRIPLTTGVGGTLDDLEATTRVVSKMYYRSLWMRFARTLREERGTLAGVSSPCVGNPHGVWLDDRLLQLDTLRHAYNATVLLRVLEPDAGAALEVLEIGGGLGGQAVQFMAAAGESVRRYTIIDLPEVAALAGFVLMAVGGEQAVRLYGEPSTPRTRVEILPPWAITEIASQSCDLVVNANSFAEMDAATVDYYLHEVERISRRLFFHDNHQTRFRYRQADGTYSTNRLGSEIVPRPDLYRLRCRSPRRFVRPEMAGNRAFEYLYERTSTRT